jgi:hypothetical protein
MAKRRDFIFRKPSNLSDETAIIYKQTRHHCP